MSRERSSKPTLLIADLLPTRHGIRIALDGSVDVCAEAEDAEQAIIRAEREQPDVCAVGLDLAGGCRRAVEGILLVAPQSRVLVITRAPDSDELISSVRMGATGYVAGSIDPAALRRAVVAAAEGEAVIPRAMVIELVRTIQETDHDSDACTPREAQVLRLVRSGHSTAAIAERLTISPVTVRRHISTLMRKAGVNDRVGLTAMSGPPSAPAEPGAARRLLVAPDARGQQPRCVTQGRAGRRIPPPARGSSTRASREYLTRGSSPSGR
jgi:DNA-binding NarL/FixJ family response regulator